ncbi:MAG: hypothetical protein ACK4TA_09090 [Saprospiraceae bacterium]
MSFFVTFFFAILLLGLLDVFIKVRNFKNKLIYITDYRNDFARLVFEYKENEVLNHFLYERLLKSSYSLQTEIDILEKMSYRPAFAPYIIKNYQVLINTIPKFRDGTIDVVDINFADDSLIRYIGFVENLLSMEIHNLYNPLKWFHSGISALINLPFRVLSSFGLISSSREQQILTHINFKQLSSVIAVFAFIGTVMGIIADFEEVKNFLSKIFNK